MTGLLVFVAAVGCFLLVSALANWDWYKGIADFAAVESLLGENAARWLFGLVLIGFGVASLTGSR